jgi:predicted transcriptional regulator
MDEDLLALSRRRTIFEHISKFPGTYLREMEKQLSLSIGDLQSHLHQLEKASLISSHEEGRYKRYFVNAEVSYVDREILSLVRMKTPRRIVMFLLLNPESCFTEILAEFNFTKGALSFHLKRLLRAHILIKGRKDKKNIYKVADGERMSQILITYKSSMMDETLDGFIDMWTKIG